MEKSASALSFLDIPTKRSGGFYELKAIEAADAYLDHGVKPNDALFKIATEHGLGKEPIHRLVELTNHEINQRLSTDSDDQTFTFPTASVAGVMAKPVSKEASNNNGYEFSKVADFGIYDGLDDLPDYRDYLSSVRSGVKWAQGEVKTAEDPEPVVLQVRPPHPARARALSQVRER